MPDSLWIGDSEVVLRKNENPRVSEIDYPANRESPPTAEGTPDELRLGPDGVLHRKRPDPWSLAVPSDVGAEGVDGVIWRAGGVALSTRGTPVSQYRLAAPANQLAMSNNITETDGTTFQRLEFRTSGHTFLRMEPGVADFNFEIENDVGFALRDSDGNTAFHDKTDLDAQEPYHWFSDSERAASTNSLIAFVSRTGAPPFDMIIYRRSGRGAGDPLNTWIPAVRLRPAAAEVASVWASTSASGWTMSASQRDRIAAMWNGGGHDHFRLEVDWGTRHEAAVVPVLQGQKTLGGTEVLVDFHMTPGNTLERFRARLSATGTMRFERASGTNFPAQAQLRVVAVPR